jgi:hypothetical protein
MLAVLGPWAQEVATVVALAGALVYLGFAWRRRSDRCDGCQPAARLRDAHGVRSAALRVLR